jgi:hypothetical protein
MKLISGVASLLAGAVIYLLFRSKNLLGFELLNRIGVEPWADRMRLYTADVRLPDMVVNSLPGGLWALGYILIIDSLFGNQSRSTRIVWASVIPLLGVCSEVLQGVGLLPGVFDLWDLICYALPFIIFVTRI